jgi:CheY-like chemotaxis protein
MWMDIDVAANILRKYKMKVDCVLSGQEAVERIRALGTEYAQKLPLIALTASAIQGTQNIFLNTA